LAVDLGALGLFVALALVVLPCNGVGAEDVDGSEDGGSLGCDDGARLGFEDGDVDGAEDGAEDVDGAEDGAEDGHVAVAMFTIFSVE